MGDSIIIVGDIEFDVDVVSYEVAQNKYKNKPGVSAIFNLSNEHKESGIVSAWDEFSARVRAQLETGTIDDMWEDPLFKLQAEENLQVNIMEQFRIGDQENNVAINAMILWNLNKQTAPITNPVPEASDDSDQSVPSDVPSKVGISAEKSVDILLTAAVPAKELEIMRTTKKVKIISKELITGFTTGNPIPINTKEFIGISEENLEKAVRDLIAQEVLKSKGKPLYISKEPKITFNKKDDSKFKIVEIVEVCTPNEESKV